MISSYNISTVALMCCYHLQSELSIQFDDLFKKAWDEDFTDFKREGIYDLSV